MSGMTKNAEEKKYKLKEVCIRLAEGHPLYSDVPISGPEKALEVMRKELASLDREMLCVVNVDNRLKPINFNIVSIGNINQSIASIPNILKSGLLSNAYGFLLLHNHPSGDVSPSQEDIRLTKRCIEAGKLMEIPCLDHVIVGGGFGSMLSFKESQILDFTEKTINMTAEQIMAVSESSTEYNGEDAGKGANDMAENMMNNVPDFVREAEEWAARDGDGQNPGKREEVTLKFGKGLAEPFTSKDGKDYMRILIPNADKGDSTPWASFVLPAKAVHENQYGKGLWAKIPADGTTTISRPTLKGKDENGKNIWQNVRIEVANSDLKAMVESYKTRAPQEKETKPRESTREKLDALVKDTASKVAVDKPKAKTKSKKGPEL